MIFKIEKHFLSPGRVCQMNRRMIHLLRDGRAHSTKPARANIAGRPMKLDTGAIGIDEAARVVADWASRRSA